MHWKLDNVRRLEISWIRTVKKEHCEEVKLEKDESEREEDIWETRWILRAIQSPSHAMRLVLTRYKDQTKNIIRKYNCSQ